MPLGAEQERRSFWTQEVRTGLQQSVLRMICLANTAARLPEKLPPGLVQAIEKEKALLAGFAVAAGLDPSMAGTLADAAKRPDQSSAEIFERASDWAQTVPIRIETGRQTAH